MTNEQSSGILDERDADKVWNELKITNDFLFNKLMQNQKLCKRLLEIVLEVKIDRIEFPQTEKVMKMTAEGKGVRLDVYVADEKHTVYNVEMQAANTKELPKRSRYYQGIIDMDIIAKGQLYNSLRTSYVIFICTFDLFEAGLYKYTFENRCKENPEIVLGDGTQKIFLNATAIMDGIEMDDDLKAFLSYVNGLESENEFVQELKEEMKKVKSNENWRRDYMMQHMRDQLNREEGRTEGRTEGRSEGRTEERVELIRAKILKSKPLDTIADELECEVVDIQGLYDAVMQCGAESSVEEVMLYLAKE